MLKSLLLWRNAFLQSTCMITKSLLGEMANRVRIVSIRTTGENVSSKSNPASCVNPLTTMHALYRSKAFVASRLIRQTHLRFPGGNFTNIHVLRAIIALISSQNASHHKLASGRRMASENEGGSLSG